MSDDLVRDLLVGAAVKFLNTRLEQLFQWCREKTRNNANGIITILEIPDKIKIDTWYTLSAKYKGNAKSAFFSCRIEDLNREFCWYGDYGDDKSIKRGFNKQGEYFEKGMLNLKNGSYSSRWNFKADPSLKPGKGKVTVGIFEMKDFVDEGGKRKQFRPLIIAEDRDIILY